MSQSLYTSQVPAVQATDGSAPGITTSTAMTFDTAGSVSGIRFWAPTVGAASDFTCELWMVTGPDDGSPAGTLMASAVPTTITPGGWTNVLFSTPVTIDTTHAWRAAVSSHSATTRAYVATGHFFDTAVVNGHITGLASKGASFPFMSNGTFADGVPPGTYPAVGFNAGGYFIDVLFDPAGTPTVIDMAATLTATAGLTVGLSREVRPTVALTATSSLTVGLTREVTLAASLTATAGLTVGLTKEVRLAAGLTATGGLSVALAREATLPTTLTATAGMTVGLTAESRLAASLTATSGLSVTFTVPTPPTPAPVDPIGMPIAEELLACFTEQLATLESPPKYIQLRLGQDTGPLIGANVDECCAGLAWIRISDIYPSWDSFPSADNTWLPCGPLAYAVVLEMGMAFCMPWSATDEGFDNIDPPSTADWATAAATQMAHQTLMRRTAACCFRPTQRRAVGAWTPLPVEGGCTGGKLTVTVSVPAPCSDC